MRAPRCRLLLTIALALFMAACSSQAVPAGRAPSSRRSSAATTSTSSPPVTTSPFASPARGFSLGANVPVINLLPGRSFSPTGPALVSLLVSDHIRLVRLLAGDASSSVDAGLLHDGGWRTVFDELDRAGIGGELLIGGRAGVDGVFHWGHWPGEPPTPDFPRPGQQVESTARYVANESAIIDDIKDQCGGLPPALVALEVANEPLVTPATLPMIAQALDAARSEAPGVPVTIGGWRAPSGRPLPRWDYNDPATASQVAPLVDFVSAHLYPDNIAGGRRSTDPATYLPTARAFLAGILAAAGPKPVSVGEFGAPDGRPVTGPAQQTGGSPGHQTAVVEAVIKAMVDADPHVTGGTVWELEPGASPAWPCAPDDLICWNQPVEPALGVLAAAAAADDSP